MLDFIFDFILEKVGLGWFILGIIAGLMAIGLFASYLDMGAGCLVIGIIVLVGVWVIGGVRRSRK